MNRLPHPAIPENWYESKTQTEKPKRRKKVQDKSVDPVQAFSLVCDTLRIIGRKLEVIDVEGDRDMFSAANTYLDQYEEDERLNRRRVFTFLSEMVSTRARYKGNLTWGQVKGILNCLRADLERDAREPDSTKAPPPDVVEPVVPNGYFTIPLVDGNRVTLRFRSAVVREGSDLKLPKGAQVASYLSGPQNTSDYQRFAWVMGKEAKVWKRYREDSRIVNALKALLTGDYKTYGAEYALESGNCCRCGRLLTVPESIAAGIGPECASKGW